MNIPLISKAQNGKRTFYFSAVSPMELMLFPAENIKSTLSIHIFKHKVRNTVSCILSQWPCFYDRLFYRRSYIFDLQPNHKPILNHIVLLCTKHEEIGQIKWKTRGHRVNDGAVSSTVY